MCMDESLKRYNTASHDSGISASQFPSGIFSFKRGMCISLWKVLMNIIMVGVEKKGLQVCHDILNG